MRRLASLGASILALLVPQIAAAQTGEKWTGQKWVASCSPSDSLLERFGRRQFLLAPRGFELALAPVTRVETLRG